MDFDDDESATALTLHVSRDKDPNRDGYTLHIENVGVELTLTGDESAPLIESPARPCRSRWIRSSQVCAQRSSRKVPGLLERGAGGHHRAR